MKYNKTKFGEMTYQNLPDFYKNIDNTLKPIPEPLRRYLNLLGVGLDEIYEYSNDLLRAFDIDTIDDRFLEPISKFLGLEFPYYMDNKEKRKLLKIIAKLYATKGTKSSFEYLAREIFGTKTKIEVNKVKYEEGMTPEEWRYLFIEITADEDIKDLDKKKEDYFKMAEIVRPVNTIIGMALTLMYYEYYDKSRLRDLYSFDELHELSKGDSYKKYLDLRENVLHPKSKDLTGFILNGGDSTLSSLKPFYEIEGGVKDSENIAVLIELIEEIYQSDKITEKLVKDIFQEAVIQEIYGRRFKVFESLEDLLEDDFLGDVYEVYEEVNYSRLMNSDNPFMLNSFNHILAGGIELKKIKGVFDYKYWDSYEFNDIDIYTLTADDNRCITDMTINDLTDYFIYYSRYDFMNDYIQNEYEDDARKMYKQSDNSKSDIETSHLDSAFKLRVDFSDSVVEFKDFTDSYANGRIKDMSIPTIEDTFENEDWPIIKNNRKGVLSPGASSTITPLTLTNGDGLSEVGLLYEVVRGTRISYEDILVNIKTEEITKITSVDFKLPKLY